MRTLAASLRDIYADAVERVATVSA